MESTRERVESTREAGHAGELNYLLTQVAIDYIGHNGLSYRTINDVVGAFECAKAEFQRRVVADYEDQAILRNGDVYGPLS